MIYWPHLLHFYQPPTQTTSMLMKISNESHRPLVDVFEEFPRTQVKVCPCIFRDTDVASFGSALRQT
jgi:hypothetical protein